MAFHGPPQGARRPLGLLLALFVYGILSAITIQELGRVGEVAQSWTRGAPAQVVVSIDPILWADGAAAETAGHRWGPFVASQARPLETLNLGNLSLPLAVNQYTGGLADWPSLLALAATGSQLAPLMVHLLVHRFLRFHGTDIAATIAALLLATDWGFHFYRKALGGTEVLLQAAVLLCLWALWSRRWAGGRHGLTALGVGLGLGLLAKLTFVLSFAALGLAALILRKDKPPLRPPLPTRPWMPLVWAALLVSPLLIAGLHHALAVPADPHIISHDFADMQWKRVVAAVTGGPSPARESVVALWSWLGEPSRFLETALGARVTGAPVLLRWVGWGLVGLGALSAWRDRHPTPHLALLRLSGLFLLLQVGLIWGVARDMATPVAAIVAGLSLDALMSRWTPPRSPARAATCLLLAVPWMAAGIVALDRTDAALATVERPTVTRTGQARVADLLRRSAVIRVVMFDYELAGALEPLVPEIDVIHGWGLASRLHRRALRPMLKVASGNHLLVIPDSPGWTYNLKPRLAELKAAGSEVGLEVVVADRLSGDGAVLYAVYPRVGSP